MKEATKRHTEPANPKQKVICVEESKRALEERELALKRERQRIEERLAEIQAQIEDAQSQIEAAKKEAIARYHKIRAMPFARQLEHWTREDLFTHRHRKSTYGEETKANWPNLYQLAKREGQIPLLLKWLGADLNIKAIGTMGTPCSIILETLKRDFDLEDTFLSESALIQDIERFWERLAQEIETQPAATKKITLD